MKIEERNKQIVRSLLEATDIGDFEMVKRHYHKDFIEHNPLSAMRVDEGRKGVEKAFGVFNLLFPLRKHIIEDILAEGDKVAARISFIASAAKNLRHLPLQEQEYKITSTAIYRLKEFQIIEKWTQVSVLKELGISLDDIKKFMHDES